MRTGFLTAKNASSLFIAATLAAIALGFGLSPWVDLHDLFARTAYYFQWATFIGLARAVYAEDPTLRPVTVLKRSWPYVVLAVALTAAIFLAVAPDFRVLADESNLLSTSRSLWHDRRMLNLIQGETYYGYWYTLESGLPTRPSVFPFLVSLFHSLRGFDAAHAFALNFCVSVALFLVLVRCGKARGDTGLGVVAAIMTTAFPLYALVVTSGGYDGLNLLFVMLIFYKMHDFLTAPNNRKLETLVLLAVIGAQVRYETVLLLGVVAAATALRWRTVLAQPVSWRLPLVPLLLLPIPWQRLAMGMHTLMQDGRTDVFDTRHIGGNLHGIYKLFLSPELAQFPRSLVLLALAAVGLAWAATRIYRQRAARPTVEAAALGAAGLGLISLVHLAFYMGDVSTAYQMRLAVVYAGALALFAAIPVRWAMRRAPVAVSGILVAMLLHNLPVAASNEVGKSLVLYREYKGAREALQDKVQPFVVVSDWPVLYAALGWGAVSFDFVKNNAGKITRAIDMSLYDAYAVKIEKYSGGSAQTLPPQFRSETVKRFQNDADSFVHVVRIYAGADIVGPPRPD